MPIIIYLSAVITACILLPFLSGFINWNGESKQALILKMGRMIQRYNQTGKEDFLQVAQVIAHELKSMGVRISAATQQKLMGE